MASAFIPPVAARTAEKQPNTNPLQLPALQVSLPTEKSTIDDKLRIEIDIRAHQLLRDLCIELADKIASESPQVIVLLDQDLRAGLELLVSTMLQLDAAAVGFQAARKHADEAHDWWEKNRPKPPRDPNEVNAQALNPITSAPVFSPSGAVSNLLSLAQVQSQFFGRDVTIQDSALYCALLGALSEKSGEAPVFGTSIFGPSGLRITEDSGEGTFLPARIQTKLNEVLRLRGEAALRVDQFARIAAMEPKESPNKALLASTTLTLQDEVAASSLLLEAMNGLFGGKPADGKASGLELVLRAAHLLEELAEAKKEPLFVFAKVETAGGTFRIIRSLHQLLSGSDGVEFRAGLVLSYACFDLDGQLKLSGLLDKESKFREMEQGNPRATWGPILLVLAMIFAVPKLLELMAALVKK